MTLRCTGVSVGAVATTPFAGNQSIEPPAVAFESIKTQKNPLFDDEALQKQTSGLRKLSEASLSGFHWRLRLRDFIYSVQVQFLVVVVVLVDLIVLIVSVSSPKVKITDAWVRQVPST